MRISVLFILLFSSFASLNAQIFESNWEEATKKAKAENKTMVLVFSGSDWCIPCIKLEREVWENEFFQTHAKKNYVMYRADFPKRKKNQLPKLLKEQNETLAQTYNPEGYFPYVVVFDSNLNAKGTFGYEKKEVSAYIKQINEQ